VRRLLSLLPLTLLVLVLSALPAFAADEPPVYTGTFEGLAYAAIAGVVLGLVYFLMLPADTSRPEHDDHH
jgi:hypothetical protein